MAPSLHNIFANWPVAKIKLSKYSWWSVVIKLRTIGSGSAFGRKWFAKQNVRSAPANIHMHVCNIKKGERERERERENEVLFSCLGGREIFWCTTGCLLCVKLSNPAPCFPTSSLRLPFFLLPPRTCYLRELYFTVAWPIVREIYNTDRQRERERERGGRRGPIRILVT